MKPEVPRRGPSRYRDLSWPRFTVYLLAVVLPLVSSALTARFHVLQTIPFALYFISVALIAALGGIAPAFLAIALSALSRNYFMAPGHRLFYANLDDTIRLLILAIAAFLVGLIETRRRGSSAKLQAAHAELSERTAALIETLHASKCAFWTFDLVNQPRTRWYSGSYQVFGRPFAEIENLESNISLLHPDDQPRLAELIHRMKTTSDPIRWEYRAPWPNGEVHWLEMRATRIPARSPAGSVMWRGVTIDITERKLAEAALLHSEKLAAMGRLASTVAHEINNPLESVTNLLYLARSDDALSPDTKAYLALAEQELARLGDITRLTLGFVRTSASRGLVDVAGVVDEVLAIFRHRLETRSVRIERDFKPGVAIFIAAHELRQILTNLISNAVDALNGSDCRIAIQIAECDAPAAVRIVVEDSGVGIAESQLPRIFDPFFTTKHDIGTGIGLWVTRELVETNGGRISVESGALPNGMKTRFRIDFPQPAP